SGDWSSDVCSSDLSSRRGRPLARVDAIPCRLIGAEAVVDEGYDLSSRIDRDGDVSIRAGTIDVQSRKIDGCPGGAGNCGGDRNEAREHGGVGTCERAAGVESLPGNGIR